MKKHFLKSFALIAMLFSALNLSAASGVDWSTIEFLGDGAGGGTYSNKYKVSAAEGLSVVNIQKPGFADEAGIYVTVPAGISDCSVASGIQGAGIVLYLSAFTAQETEVTINYAGGSCTFWVYYADGTTGEGGGDEGSDEGGEGEGEGGETPDPDEGDGEEEGTIDWSTIAWLGNGSGDDANTDKYKVSAAEGLNVVNIQKPGFADEAGIYVNVPSGISACSVNGAIDGAGVVLYLSAFTAQETEVTITHALGSITFWVYYADGTTGEGGGDEGGETTGVPTNEELWEAFKPYYNTFYGLSRADQTIDKVSTFANAKMQEIMTSATSEYKWLGDYILSVATAAGVTLPTDMAEANEGAWRWAVHAFFNAEAGQHGATGIDFTEAGKPEAWGPAYLAAQGGGEGGEGEGEEEGGNLFDASKASIKETYFAPNWTVETNSTATYDATTGTITVDLKSQFYGQYQAQVKLQHNVVFSADKQYMISAKFHSTANVDGITLKMDDNAEVVYENQSIDLVANETLYYSSNPGNGVEGNNQIIVFDFGWAVPSQITISEITIEEVGGSVTPPEVEHPAAAAAPTLPAEQVFSIYSDVYSTTVTRGMGGWGQSTKEEEVALAEGDKALYYTTCNYLGWELNGNVTIGDMTAYPMLHMDIYVAEADSIEFTPIWGSEALKKYDLQAGWNAIDINLAADFADINLANIYQIKWANMPETCYIDNVYFYNQGPATAIGTIKATIEAQKIIRNGQLIIIRGGVSYDVMGNVVR